jgi:tRNA modification GTPase
MRDTGDPVEEEGVRRARARAEASDLVLWVTDATDPLPPPADLVKPGAPPVWVLSNKSDLTGRNGPKRALEGEAARCGSTQCYHISALTGASFDDLVGGLAEFARRFFSGGTESALVTRQRHRSALIECVDALGRAWAEDGSGREDIIAEELRLAARALGRLVGRVDVENVLDVIFRDFCIGK